ncbi:hypothetical protein ABZ070_33625, partial [Streptomyces sp. NPDC006283]
MGSTRPDHESGVQGHVLLQGRGGNKSLIDIKNCQARPPGDVAKDVQNSHHPELYAGHESAMRTLDKEGRHRPR